MKSNELTLSGLTESHFPISALDAFGLLAVLQRDHPDIDWRLSWPEMPLRTAQLHAAVSRQQLIEWVAASATAVATNPVWTAGDDLASAKKGKGSGKKVLLDQQDIIKLLRNVAGSDLEDLALGLARLWPYTPSPLHMTSGKQSFLSTIRQAADERDQRTGNKDAAEELLYGPWTYQDVISSLGYDPANNERYHALEAVAPSNNPAQSVRLSVWLAAEALALYPQFDGMDTDADGSPLMESSYYFPIWSQPLSLVGLYDLLHLPLHKLDPEIQQPAIQDGTVLPDLLNALGVDVYRSARVRLQTKSNYYALRVSIPVFTAIV